MADDSGICDGVDLSKVVVSAYHAHQQSVILNNQFMF